MVLVLMATGCESTSGDADMAVVDMAVVDMSPRCGEWSPARAEARLASWSVDQNIRTLPALQAEPDVSRTIGVSVAYAPGQEVTNAQADAMLNASPLCLPPDGDGVACKLHFMRNGDVKKARDASSRGKCIEKELLDIASAMSVTDRIARGLMGLNEANTYSMDGPISNILFVNDLDLTLDGSNCNPGAVACAFWRSGAALIEKPSVINAQGTILRPTVLKHEIGHLHRLEHINIGNVYVSRFSGEEERISQSRCKHMRKHRPQNYSPWFEAHGGTIGTAGHACP